MSIERTALKVTGFSSTARLHDIFGSHLVDIAYISDVGGGIAIVEPDDPDVFEDQADPGWLPRVVLSTLHSAGETSAVVEICRVERD
jgi:hypothetical protein